MAEVVGPSIDNAFILSCHRLDVNMDSEGGLASGMGSSKRICLLTRQAIGYVKCS